MTISGVFISVPGSEISIDWQHDGDELLHSLYAAIANHVSDVGGQSMSTHPPTEEEPFYFIEISVTSEKLRYSLCLFPREGGLTAFIRVPDSDPEIRVDQLQLDTWTRVLAVSVAGVGANDAAFTWSAVIGPTPDHNSQQKLASEGAAAGLRLIPDSNAQLQVDGSTPLTLSGGQLFHSFPIIVRGEDRGYAFQVAQESAIDRLDRLCCVLSIAWDTCWQMRMAPWQGNLEPGGLPVGDFPEIVRQQDEWHFTPVSVPEWLDEAMQLLDADADILQAVRAFHQGLTLEPRHPSFALIAYVAVIESIGSRDVDLTRCECCENCSVQTGSTRRFRAGLKHVLTGAQRRRLEKIYTLRSKTAHEGRLHGPENQPGVFRGLRFFSSQDATLFRYQEVWPLRDAARQLLLKALRSELPAPTAPSFSKTTEA